MGNERVRSFTNDDDDEHRPQQRRKTEGKRAASDLTIAERNFLELRTRIGRVRETIRWTPNPHRMFHMQILDDAMKQFWLPVADYLRENIVSIPQNHPEWNRKNIFTSLTVTINLGRTNPLVANIDFFAKSICSAFIHNEAYHNAYLHLRDFLVERKARHHLRRMFHSSNASFFPHIWKPYNGKCFWHHYLLSQWDVAWPQVILLDPYINEMSCGNITIWQVVKKLSDVCLLLSRNDLDLTASVEGKSVAEYRKERIVQSSYHRQYLAIKEIIHLILRDLLLPDLRDLLISWLYYPNGKARKTKKKVD